MLLRSLRARESSAIRITEIDITNASLTSFELEFQHSNKYEVTVFAWNNLGRSKASTAREQRTAQCKHNFFG